MIKYKIKIKKNEFYKNKIHLQKKMNLKIV